MGGLMAGPHSPITILSRCDVLINQHSISSIFTRLCLFGPKNGWLWYWSIWIGFKRLKTPFLISMTILEYLLVIFSKLIDSLKQMFLFIFLLLSSVR